MFFIAKIRFLNIYLTCFSTPTTLYPVWPFGILLCSWNSKPFCDSEAKQPTSLNGDVFFLLPPESFVLNRIFCQNSSMHQLKEISNGHFFTPILRGSLFSKTACFVCVFYYFPSHFQANWKSQLFYIHELLAFTTRSDTGVTLPLSRHCHLTRRTWCNACSVFYFVFCSTKLHVIFPKLGTAKSFMFPEKSQ